MTSTDENRFFFPAWGVSLALHGIVVGLALAFATQVKPILSEDAFTWDVALVEGTKSESTSKQVKSPMTPAQPPASEMAPLQKKRISKAPEPVRSIEQKIEPPPIEPVQAIEEKVETPRSREEAIEQRIVEAPQPTVEAKQPEPVAVAASTEPVEARSAQHEPVAESAVSASSHDGAASQESPAQLPSHDGGVDTAPVQVAKATAAGPEAKVDNRWLAESLWRRVAELKRYPNSARMNGEEGKVILKAVIRSDGHLADVFILKSSGHSALDAAAIEAVKLACPLHMKHAIGKPQIVVSLPIVYSLAN